MKKTDNKLWKFSTITSISLSILTVRQRKAPTTEVQVWLSLPAAPTIQLKHQHTTTLQADGALPIKRKLSP